MENPQKSTEKSPTCRTKSHIDFTFPITIRECVALGRTVYKETIATIDERRLGKKVDTAIEEAGRSDYISNRGSFWRSIPTYTYALHGSIAHTYFWWTIFGLICFVYSEKVIMTILRKWKEEGKIILNGQPWLIEGERILWPGDLLLNTRL